MKIQVGDKFKDKYNGAIVEVVKVMKKTIDYKFADGKIVPQVRMTAFVARYEQF